MTADAIKAALAEAAWAQCEARARVNECEAARCPRREPCPWCAHGAAAAIAAFLDAIWPASEDMNVAALADEVRRAAREGGG